MPRPTPGGVARRTYVGAGLSAGTILPYPCCLPHTFGPLVKDMY